MMLGGEVEAPSPLGLTQVQIPKGAQPGETVRSFHEGIPSLKNSQRGDLIYHIQVKIPKKMSTEEESLLKELAQLRGLSLESDHSKKAGSSFWGRKK
jgi:molecular chaperone DnaJ